MAHAATSPLALPAGPVLSRAPVAAELPYGGDRVVRLLHRGGRPRFLRSPTRVFLRIVPPAARPDAAPATAGGRERREPDSGKDGAR